MKGDKIPDKDHIARFCKASAVENGEIQASAFMVRTGEESLSVNWLEFLDCASRKEELITLRRIFAEKKITLTARAKMAVLNVGDVCERILAESPDRRLIKVIHDPELEDPSHSGIYNLKQDDELIAELILETVNESYPARP